MFVAGALELERPFLGPLYKFMVLHPRESMRRVPSFVSFILHFLADQVAATRHYNCAEILESSEEAPRVDAQASDVRTGIGGWFPRRGDGGNIEPRLSPWFSLEITHEEWPWVFAKSQKASLIISTLEALAVLVALKLRFGEEPGRSKERVRIAPTLTDNRGNGAALNKLMTTKFLASALLMELACYMSGRRERGTRRRTDSRTGITEPLTRLFVFRSVLTVSAGLSFRKRLQQDRERRVDSRS